MPIRRYLRLKTTINIKIPNLKPNPFPKRNTLMTLSFTINLKPMKPNMLISDTNNPRNLIRRLQPMTKSIINRCPNSHNSTINNRRHRHPNPRPNHHNTFLIKRFLNMNRPQIIISHKIRMRMTKTFAPSPLTNLIPHKTPTIRHPTTTIKSPTSLLSIRISRIPKYQPLMTTNKLT